MRRVSLAIMLALAVLLPSPLSTLAKAPGDGSPVSGRHTPSDAYHSVQRQQAAPLAAGDGDSDGLPDANELTLKTDPTNADSDCDAIDDKTEVGTGAAPADGDGDKLIDALENNSADSNTNGTKDNLDPVIGKQITCGRAVPFAIRDNGTDTTRLEIRVAGSNVTAVRVPIFDAILVDGVRGVNDQLIPLFDDGTHGDLRAGDGLWSRGGISSDLGSFNWANDAFFWDFEVTDASGTSMVDIRNALGPSAYIKIGVVEDSPSVLAQSYQLRPNVFAASNLLNVVDPLAAVKASGGEFAPITKQLYETGVLSDSYDFVMFMADRYWPINATAYYLPVRNSVQNIGQGQMDSGAAFGSPSRLQGLLVMNFFRNPPILHELMHRWGTPDLSALGFHQCAGPAVHWGVAGLGRGQLGGFDSATLVNNNNGTYTVGEFSAISNAASTYAPLELYLAGLIDASQVPPMSIPTNVNCSSLVYGENGIRQFSAGPLSTVTIGQITTALGGSRIPSAASAQKNFAAAPVIVSQYPLNSAELAYYNAATKNVSAQQGAHPLTPSFAQVTGGRGTLNTTMYTPPPLIPRLYIPLLKAVSL